MRGAPRGFLLALLLVSASGCSDDGNSQVDAMPPQQPFFDPATVKTWPEVRNCRFSIEHDGVQVQVFASPEAATAYTEGTYPLPEGAVIVKVEHDDSNCDEPLAYTAMRKLASGAAPANGDWEWQRVDADGEVQEWILMRDCVSCHSACTEGRDLTCTDP
ncbi:MAG TPA: cytochrome P460 family protein [Actinoplanes sp.]|nr:cytochrome P460 family protein [Actinoplanes sp.]